MKPGVPLLGRIRAQLTGLGLTVRDALHEANGRRQLDERMQRTDEDVRHLRRELDTLKAQLITTQERHDAIIAKLVGREAQALAALQAGHAALAREVAAAIVALEHERDAERALLARNAAHCTQLQVRLQQGENMLRRLGHELDLLRAAEAVARAEHAFADRGDSVVRGIPTAIDSLALLRARDAAQAQTATSPEQNLPARDALDAKLRAAGIGEPQSPVDAVLARIAAQMDTPMEAQMEAPMEAPPRPTRRTTRRKDTP